MKEHLETTDIRKEGYSLVRKAEEARKRRDFALAAILDKDGSAMIRMADQDEAVAAGTHYYHPLTGRFLPR